MNIDTQQILIFAPHLEYPIRNGADIYVDRLGCYLSKYRSKVLILGAKLLTIYEKGEIVCQTYFNNKSRSKQMAAIRTILFHSHYLTEKFLTNKYITKSKMLLTEYPKSQILYSFLFTSTMELSSKKAVILTHNNEILYYQNQINYSKNILAKLVANISKRWVIRNIQIISRKNILAHITEDDLSDYKNIIPNHEGFVIPVGVDVYPIQKSPKWTGKIRLLFCGSLSVKMNFDALLFFADKFFPILHQYFSDRLEVWIAGSNPIPPIIQLCSKHNWSLYPNIPNDELKDMYSRATFSVLPFKYTTGAKLKLFNSLASGLPVLATSNMKYYPTQDFFPNLFSDNPIEWLARLKRIEKSGISNNQRLACSQFANMFSWESIAFDADQFLRELRN